MGKKVNKMKENLSELVFIIDKSGSMHSLTADTIGGFNSMLESQKKEDGDAFVTTVLFDTEYKVFQDHVNIKDARFMTDVDYVPGGMTALLDALGYAIDSVGKRLAETPEEERPENVIFTIITDGLENSSKEYTKSVVKEKIEHQQSKYSWKFVFLGANMDAVKEAGGLGIQGAYARGYTCSKKGLDSAYKGMSMAVGVVRKRKSYKSEEEFEMAVCDSLDKIE